MEQSYFSLLNATVIVTSDTCSRDSSKDSSGQYVVQKLESLGFAKVTKLIVADEKELITKNVKLSLEDITNTLIITVGGTGFYQRDVTPEATSILYERYCSGIATALIVASLRYSAHAALTRLTAGIVGQCLIVNFPGKLRACEQCFACLGQFLNHAIEQIRGDVEAIKQTHLQQDERADNHQSEQEVPTANISLSSDTTLLESKKLPSLQPPSGDLIKVTNSQVVTLQPPVDKSSIASDKVLHSFTATLEDSLRILSSEIKDKLSTQSSEPIRTKSIWPLIEYAQALDILSSVALKFWHGKRILKNLNSVKSCQELLGEVLSENIYSKEILPPFPVSTMDGYVLNVSEQMMRVVFRIESYPAELVDDIEKFNSLQNDPANSSRLFCYQVNTGNRVPEKNFAVIPFEKTISSGTNNSSCRVAIKGQEVRTGRYVRAAGSDLNHSDLLEAGTMIGPVELSLILSMGHKSVQIIEKPVLGVLSTGDELVEPYGGKHKSSNEVYDCNLPLLTSFFSDNGYPITSMGIAKDNEQELTSKVMKSLSKCDVLIITGGASMGTRDYVKTVIEDIGGKIHFGRVNIKPGKPVAFATIQLNEQKKFIFSLPGNPVSAYITARTLVMPFLNFLKRKFLGNHVPLSLDDLGNQVDVQVASITEAKGEKYLFEDRLEFIRAKFIPEKKNQVKVSIKQQSSRLLSLRNVDCLLMIEPSNKGISLEVGQTYKAIRL